MALERPEREASRRLAANLARCREVVRAAALRAGRNPSEVSVMAVTKYSPAWTVPLLHEMGVRDFGESTVQGAEEKVEAVGALEGARWHLIGHLQRNKAARAIQLFTSIHSIDSDRIARELRAQAERRSLAVPELFVELNLSGEAAKTGLGESSAKDLLAWMRGDDVLAPRVRGLMAMAPHGGDPESSRPVFRRLRELRDELSAQGLLPRDSGLSMGMSGDVEVAVEEGATVVRVGSLLFEGVE
jgi:pyridoxal phosphate enzyme (YggS family)